MEKIIGIVYAYDPIDAYDTIRGLGFNWMRMHIPFPWEDRMFGTPSRFYLRAREEIRKAVNAGFKVMPTTPGMGGYRFDPETKTTRFRDDWPAFAGEKGTEEYFENVAAAMEFAARDLGDLSGGIWQVMNEIDTFQFSGDYSDEVVAGTARASAQGIVRADPKALCGINLSRYYDRGLEIADLCYAPGHAFGYIGDDQYFGSWQGKDVESWNTVIDALHERYQLPVIANEWGYSSGGRVLPKRPDPKLIPPGLNDVCYMKAWYHEVEGGHTEEVQAKYLRRGLQIFAENPNVLGSFLFCYKDAAHCYHCGADDCPAEDYWGIVDKNEKPKKAFYAVSEAIKEYYK